MTNSQRGTHIETEVTWQSHHIEWTRIIGISNPCIPNVGYQRIVAIYIEILQSGVSYYNKNNLSSATVQWYTAAVNILFELRGYKLPIDMHVKNKMAGIIMSIIMKKRI